MKEKWRIFQEKNPFYFVRFIHIFRGELKIVGYEGELHFI